MRAVGIVLSAVVLHCLGTTDAGAQFRGGVPGIGGIAGIGSSAPGVGSVASGVGEAVPLPGQVVPSDAVGAVSGAQDAVPSNLDRAVPLNSVTNSLAGPVTGAVTGATNGVLGAPGTPLGQVGAISRPAQNARPRNGSGVPPAGERRYVPREVVIGLASDISPRARADLARRHGLTPIEAQQIALTGTTYHRWRIADGRSVSDVIRALEADGVVRTAQPNYRFTLAQSPQALGGAPEERKDANLQYAPDKLHLAEAHRFATGAKVLVAIIDSGIDTSHPEIADAVADRYDAIAPAGLPHFHGTGMAGAIVARSRITGSAPGARLLAIRAFSGDEEKSEATTVSILRGLDWAMAHGARVINMSFAGPYDPDIARGLAAARQKGAVLVAAAGNAGPKSPPLYPAADKNVIAVTATNSDNQLLPQANRGHYIAVAAPGVDVLVPSPGKEYRMSTGTSVAAAEVSGIAALLIELQPALTPDEVRKILQSTALDLGPKGFDEQYGAGLVDAQRAVLSLAPSAAAHPTPAMLFVDRWPDMPLSWIPPRR
jgi:subtilisin family serine protease